MHGVIVVLLVERAGEIVHLTSHVFFSHLKSFFARLGLNEGLLDSFTVAVALLLGKALGPHRVDKSVLSVVAKRLVLRAGLSKRPSIAG